MHDCGYFAHLLPGGPSGGHSRPLSLFQFLRAPASATRAVLGQRFPPTANAFPLPRLFSSLSNLASVLCAYGLPVGRFGLGSAPLHTSSRAPPPWSRSDPLPLLRFHRGRFRAPIGRRRLWLCTGFALLLLYPFALFVDLGILVCHAHLPLSFHRPRPTPSVRSRAPPPALHYDAPFAALSHPPPPRVPPAPLRPRPPHLRPPYAPPTRPDTSHHPRPGTPPPARPTAYPRAPPPVVVPTYFFLESPSRRSVGPLAAFFSFPLACFHALALFPPNTTPASRSFSSCSHGLCCHFPVRVSVGHSVPPFFLAAPYALLGLSPPYFGLCSTFHSCHFGVMLGLFARFPFAYRYPEVHVALISCFPLTLSGQAGFTSFTQQHRFVPAARSPHSSGFSSVGLSLHHWRRRRCVRARDSSSP